jgi:hypothetical protein
MQGIPKGGGQYELAASGKRVAIASEDEFRHWLIAALEWERQCLGTSGSANSSAGGGRQQ